MNISQDEMKALAQKSSELLTKYDEKLKWMGIFYKGIQQTIEALDTDKDFVEMFDYATKKESEFKTRFGNKFKSNPLYYIMVNLRTRYKFKKYYEVIKVRKMAAAELFKISTLQARLIEESALLQKCVNIFEKTQKEEQNITV